MSHIKKRPLGNTGLELTELGFGGAHLSRQRCGDDETPGRLVQRALELGINFVDTAPLYGGGESQHAVGRALAGRQDACFLATKCGRWAWQDGPYRSLDAYKAQLEESLLALRRDDVELLFVHEADWAVYWEDADIPRRRCELALSDAFDYESAPVTRFLVWAREQGLVKHIGLSGNNAHLLNKVLVEFPLPIDAVLVAFQYSLLWRNAKQALIPTAKEKGVGIILGGPLQRKLAVPHPEWLEESPDWMNEDTRVRFRQLYDLQRDTGLTLAELGLRYLLADPDVTTVIPGSSNLEHLEDNVRYALAGPLPSEIHERIEPLGKVFPGLWGIDF